MNWRLRKNVSMARTDYGAVLLDEKQGCYWQLNPTGASVAEGLLAGCDIEDIAVRIATDYGVDGDQVRADVQAVVEQLRHAELLVP